MTRVEGRLRITEHDTAGMSIVVRTAGAPLALLPAKREAMRQLDPLTFVAVPVLLLLVAALAAFLPARRAAAVNPVVALTAD